MSITPELSVVVPVFNEQENIPELVVRLNTVLAAITRDYEIIFVDDASVDQTPELLAEASKTNPQIRVIRFSRNFGHQNAVTAGIDHASGQAVVILDGDLQDPPELIPQFVEKWREGHEVVYGIRKKRKEWWGKRIAYFAFYRIMRASTREVEIPLDAGDYSLISARVISVLRSLPERNRFIRGLRVWAGFKQTGIVYERHERFAGKPKYTFLQLVKLAYDGIFSFSSVPLHIITTLGLIFSVGSFLAILLVLYFRLFTSYSIPGFASLATIVLFLGGVQLLSIGIIGEYVSRIYEETKNRPHYIIEKRIGF
jgi:polyisoprenyl-phosphate glycosyltransferase